MRRRWTIWLMLCVLLVGCGSRTPTATTTPADATPVPTTGSATGAGTQVASEAPTAPGPPNASEAPPTEMASPGEEIPGPGGPEGEGPPSGDGEREQGGGTQGEDPKVLRFRVQGLGAVAALAKLPGYTYTVEHAATGLTLTGQVASPTKRRWTVALTGHPDRVVSRWVLTAGSAYTDISGEWQRSERLPFDPGFPVSFGLSGQVFPGDNAGEHDALFPSSDFSSGKVTTRTERVGAREATRVDIKHSEIDESGGPGETPRQYTSTTSMWIAKDGEYLLRHQAPDRQTDPGTGGTEIEVTPLDSPPEIQVPKLGTPAFNGAPPPWRALVVGRERLSQLGSYRFEVPGFGKGQLSDTKGRMTGTYEGEGSVSDLEIAYIGDEMWGREEKDGPWRSTSLDSNAALLFLYPPGGVPRSLLSPDQQSPIPGWQMFGLDLSVGPFPLPVSPTTMQFRGNGEANGVRALRFRGKIDLSGQFEAGAAEQFFEVEIWLAEKGHYLLRSTISGGWLEGREFRTNVFDVGEPFEVKAPSPVAPPQQQGPFGGVPATVHWAVTPTAAYAASGLGRSASVGYRDCLATGTTYTIPFSVAVSAEGAYALRLVPEADSRGMEVSVKPDTIEGDGSGTHEATLTLRIGSQEQLSTFRLGVMIESDGSMSGNQSMLSVEVPCIEPGQPSP